MLRIHCKQLLSMHYIKPNNLIFCIPLNDRLQSCKHMAIKNNKKVQAHEVGKKVSILATDSYIICDFIKHKKLQAN